MTHWLILYLALMVLYSVFKTERKNFTDTHSVENAQTKALQEDHIVFEKKGGQTSLSNFLLVVILELYV